ncbi:MAG: hypothetical protein GY789_17500 [Hyphomicrobiales bacterium]|nr:hypothetical protein [Hyphomicrobiales bacterium]
MTSNSEREDQKNQESMQERGPEREDQGDQEPTQECSPEGEQRNEKEERATAFAPMRVIEDQLGTLGMCMAVQAVEDGLPRTWRQAPSITHWKRAMAAEKEKLETMGAWVLVPKPPHAKVLPGLWRFRAKKDAKGQTVRYKAR